MMWPFLKRAVDRGVKAGVEQAVANFAKPGGGLDKAILDALKAPKFKWFWFVKAMQARMLAVDPTMGNKKAYAVALNAYRDFLHEEKIEFGHPDYDWSDDGARDLIDDYEIDHWEAKT